MKIKRKAVVLAVVVILAALGTAAGTFAYYNEEFHTHNVITSGAIRIELINTSDGTALTGASIKRDGVLPENTFPHYIGVKNRSDKPAWIRIGLEIVMKNGQTPMTVSDGLIEFDEMADWNYIETTTTDGAGTAKTVGYWYYTKPLQAEETALLTESITVTDALGNEYQDCSIEFEVTAHAVQYDNNTEVPEGDYSQIPGWPADENV